MVYIKYTNIMMLIIFMILKMILKLIFTMFTLMADTLKLFFRHGMLKVNSAVIKVSTSLLFGEGVSINDSLL